MQLYEFGHRRESSVLIVLLGRQHTDRHNLQTPEGPRSKVITIRTTDFYTFKISEICPRLRTLYVYQNRLFPQITLDFVMNTQFVFTKYEPPKA